MSRLALLMLSVCALFAFAADTDPKEKASDWPLFRRTAEQTGSTPGAAPDKLEELWKFTTEHSIESAVAVVDGVVYAASMDEHLYAIDLKTGKQKWKFKS